MANSELRYNIVYQIRGEQDLQKSINLVNSLSGDAKLLAQQIDKSGNATARQTKALKENAKQQESVIRRQQKIRENLPRTSAEYARLTDSINKGTRSVRQIDQALDRSNRTTRKTQNVYAETSSRLSKLSLNYKDLQSRVRANSISEDQAAQKSEELKIELQQLEKEVEMLGKKAGISASQMTKLKQSLINARNSGVSASRSIAGVGTAFTGTTKVNSSANQLMLSFGDIAQDSAQFSFGFAQGARAIGNNIAFAAEQVVILQAKMLASGAKTAGFGDIMRTLGAQMMGPMGIIFALNAGITAITMFATRQERLKREAGKATDALQEQADAIMNVVSGFEIGGKSFGDLTGFTNAIKTMQNIETQTGKLTERMKELVSQGYMRTEAGAVSFYGSASAYNEDYVKELGSLGPRIDSLNQSYTDLSNEFQIFAGVSDDVKKKFVELSKEQEAQQLRTKALRLDIEKNAEGGKKYYEILDELEVITGKIDLAENQRALGLDNLAISEDEARRQLQALVDQMKNSQMDPALLADLMDRLASGMSSVKEEAKDVSDELDRLKRNAEAGRAIQLFEAEATGDPEEIRRVLLEHLDKRIIDEKLTDNEIALARLEINKEADDAINAAREKSAKEEFDKEKTKQQAIQELRLLKARDNEDEIRRIEQERLEWRIKNEKLTAEQIALENERINQKYIDSVAKREEAIRKITEDSIKYQGDLTKSLASSTEQVNNQLISSLQGTFQALIPNSKAAALAILFVEKALAIGKINSEALATTAKMEIDAIQLDAKATAAYAQSILNPAMLAEGAALSAAAKSIRVQKPLVTKAAQKNAAKIAAIGLLQGASILAGGSGGGGGGGGGRGGAGAGAGSRGADSRSFGATFTDVDQRPQFVPRDGSAMASGAISVQILADRKQLYALVRQGEEEYSQIISS